MPFTKETAREAQAKGEKVKKQYKQDLWEFIASGGVQMYQDRLQKQYEGVELTKPEQEAMDRSERLFPYVKSKKMPVNDDGDSVFEIRIKTV